MPRSPGYIEGVGRVREPGSAGRAKPIDHAAGVVLGPQSDFQALADQRDHHLQKLLPALAQLVQRDDVGQCFVPAMLDHEHEVLALVVHHQFAVRQPARARPEKIHRQLVRRGKFAPSREVRMFLVQRRRRATRESSPTICRAESRRVRHMLPDIRAGAPLPACHRPADRRRGSRARRPRASSPPDTTSARSRQ